MNLSEWTQLTPMVPFSATGRGIKITTSADPGDALHTTVDSLDGLPDTIWIFAQNSDSTDHTITIEFGGNSSPDDLIPCNVPANGGLTLIVPGLPLSPGKTIRAFAAGAPNKITVFGCFRTALAFRETLQKIRADYKATGRWEQWLEAGNL